MSERFKNHPVLTWLWPDDRARRFLTVLALLFIVKQLLQIIIFPPFTGHDEIAHFDYIRTIANERRIPVIPDLAEWREAIENNQPPPGDYLNKDLYPYCYYALDWPCYPDAEAFQNMPPRRDTSASSGLIYPAGWQYAANHPPLYYALMTPIYWASEPFGLGVQMRVLRIGAIPFGLLAVISTYAIAHMLFPRRRTVAMLAATFVALQPQLSYEAALVNNDVTVIGVGTLLVALLIYGIRERFPRNVTIACGIALGCALLFKGTSVVFAPVVAVAVVGAFGIRNWRDWVPIGGSIAAIGFGLVSPWYLFLYRTYGNLNGLQQVSDIQAAWNYANGNEAPSFLSLLFDWKFVARLWGETWGGFGWRRVPFENPLLAVIGVVMALCGIGLVLFGVRAWRSYRSQSRGGAVLGIESWQWWGILSIVVLTVLGYLAVIQFGTTFQLAQARYFFASVPAFSVLLMLGWQTITPVKLARFGPVVFVGFMLALNVYIYSAYVLPYWYTGPVR
ncbi:glycosyltransferase family 39 protein [soil metagenome]